MRFAVALLGAVLLALCVPSGAAAGVNVFIGSPTIPTAAMDAILTPSPSDGVGAVPVPAVSGGGGAAVANLWVDQTATTGCTDNPSLGGYNAAQDCTWDQANDTCEGGDTVIVRGGSYGDITLSGSNSRASRCTFTAASGETVTIDEFENGVYTGANDDANGADFTTFQEGSGAITSRTLYADFNDQVTYDGWTVDGQFTVPTSGFAAQILHFQNVGTVVFKNGEVKNACAVTGFGGMIVTAGGATSLTLDNNLIHDAHACDPGGDPHTECMWSNGTSNVTISRTKFWRCAVMDVFITGWDGNTYSDGWTVENSFFGRPCGDNESPHTCDSALGNAFHFRSGAGTEVDPAPIPSGWVIRHNTFRGNLSINSGGSPPIANVIKGNAFANTAACGVTNTTYSYNAHISGSCGGTGTITNASLLSNSFTDPSDLAAGGGDWSLLTGSPLKNAGNTADHPTLDLLGISRYLGSAPDIGAYEFPE